MLKGARLYFLPPSMTPTEPTGYFPAGLAEAADSRKIKDGMRRITGSHVADSWVD